MSECTAGCAEGMANSQLVNQKLLQDAAALGLLSTMFLPIMDQIALARQRHVNAATVDNLAHVAAVTAGQTGATENQQPVSPIRTAAADTETQQPAGSSYPPIRNVDQASAQANAGIQAALQAVADAMANVQASIGAVLASLTGPAGAGAKS